MMERRDLGNKHIIGLTQYGRWIEHTPNPSTENRPVYQYDRP